MNLLRKEVEAAEEPEVAYRAQGHECSSNAPKDAHAACASQRWGQLARAWAEGPAGLYSVWLPMLYKFVSSSWSNKAAAFCNAMRHALSKLGVLTKPWDLDIKQS